VNEDNGKKKDEKHSIKGIISWGGGIVGSVITAILVIVLTPMGQQITNYLFPVMPPETNIVSVIDGTNRTLRGEDSTYSRSVKFMFNGSDDKKVSSFQCSIQDPESSTNYSPCTSPEPRGGLKPGHYVFRVKAIDSDQAEDPSPAVFSFTILNSALVQGSIHERDRPAPNLKVELDNKIESFTDVIGRFFFQAVPEGEHYYWIYDRLNNPLAGPITLIIAAEGDVKDEGTIALDLLQPQPVSSVQTFDAAPNEGVPMSDNNTQLPSATPQQAQQPNTQFLPSNDTNADEDEISLMHEAKFERDPSFHNVTVWVDGPQQTLAEVQRVTYTLHPSFQPSIVTRSSSENNFALSLSAWGQFTIEANVFFRDGEVKELSRFLSFPPKNP